MPSVLAGLTMPQLMLIVNVLGFPGLFVVFWFVMTQNQSKLIEKMDGQREEEKDRHAALLKEYKADMDLQREVHKDLVAEILKEYKADVAKVSTFYERNVELVERYEKHADDLSEIIHLNTQVMTQLVESIKHNMFCPIVRDKGPKRD